MKRRVGALAIGLAVVWAAAAEANTFKVTRTNDPNPGACTRSDCSLREAVLRANARLGADRIVLPNSRRAYRLTRASTGEDLAMDGDLDLLVDPVTILHKGKGRATIDGEAAGDRLFESYVRTNLKKLVLTGGSAPDAPSDDSGGAIEAKAPLTVSNSLLRGNVAPKFGGAISHEVGALRVIGSKLIGNRALDEAGAINAGGNRVLIKRSTIRRNRADDAGGGAMYVSLSGGLTIERSTFAGNRAMGDGGAVFVNNGKASIRGSTFSKNRSGDDGGAIISYSTSAALANSTFSGNRAGGDGGAIVNGGALVVNATTVARNVSNADEDGGGAGGGIQNLGGFVEIANSLLALNDQRVGDADDCAGSFSSAGGNLRTVDVDCGGFDGARDAVRANPKIGRLKANGGRTQTIALKRRSAAIGRAIRAGSPNRDQRGRKRDRRPDSGAYERGA